MSRIFGLVLLVAYFSSLLSAQNIVYVKAVDALGVTENMPLAEPVSASPQQIQMDKQQMRRLVAGGFSVAVIARGIHTGRDYLTDWKSFKQYIDAVQSSPSESVAGDAGGGPLTITCQMGSCMGDGPGGPIMFNTVPMPAMVPIDVDEMIVFAPDGMTYLLAGPRTESKYLKKGQSYTAKISDESQVGAFLVGFAGKAQMVMTVPFQGPGGTSWTTLSFSVVTKWKTPGFVGGWFVPAPPTQLPSHAGPVEQK